MATVKATHIATDIVLHLSEEEAQAVNMVLGNLPGEITPFSDITDHISMALGIVLTEIDSEPLWERDKTVEHLTTNSFVRKDNA